MNGQEAGTNMADSDFEVRATDPEGEAHGGRQTAESVESIVQRYREQGLQVSSIVGANRGPVFELRIADAEVFAAFNQELAGACRAGVPLPDALVALSKDMGSARLSAAIDDVAEYVREGEDYATALSHRADVFPTSYVALVRAGVSSGDLPGVLLHFAADSRVTVRVQRAVRAAMLYPLLVALLGTCMLSGMALVLAPVYQSIIQDLFDPNYMPAPPLTRLYLFLMPVFLWSPVILIVSLALGWIAWRVLATKVVGRAALARLVLKVPLLGRFVHAASLARFCRTLANALDRNVSVPDAVTLAGMASGNAAVQAAADRLSASVQEGGSIKDGLEDERVFPVSLTWMIGLGEKRGELAPVLRDYAELQEDTVACTGEVLPPVVSILGVGLGAIVVLGAAMSVFAPLIRLMTWMG